jgi:hypothetical protein
MNPSAARIGILIIELMVFFIVTAFTSYFISHASAIKPAPGEAPPPQFPVIVYDGDRARPAPGGYRVMQWSDWEKLAQGRSHATLLLPERAATVRIGEAGEASFTSIEESAARQSVALKWRTGAGEQEAHYVAQARSIEPRLMRTLGTQTLLMGAAAGFVAGLMTGRALRRRWLAVPGRWA